MKVNYICLEVGHATKPTGEYRSGNKVVSNQFRKSSEEDLVTFSMPRTSVITTFSIGKSEGESSDAELYLDISVHGGRLETSLELLQTWKYADNIHVPILNLIQEQRSLGVTHFKLRVSCTASKMYYKTFKFRIVCTVIYGTAELVSSEPVRPPEISAECRHALCTKVWSFAAFQQSQLLARRYLHGVKDELVQFRKEKDFFWSEVKGEITPMLGDLAKGMGFPEQYARLLLKNILKGKEKTIENRMLSRAERITQDRNMLTEMSVELALNAKIPTVEHFFNDRIDFMKCVFEVGSCCRCEWFSSADCVFAGVYGVQQGHHSGQSC